MPSRSLISWISSSVWQLPGAQLGGLESRHAQTTTFPISGSAPCKDEKHALSEIYKFSMPLFTANIANRTAPAFLPILIFSYSEGN